MNNIIKYKSPKTNPSHRDYSAKGNLPKGTKPNPPGMSGFDKAIIYWSR